MRVAVFGNCQARPLSSALQAAIPDLEVLDVVVVHLAKQADADQTLAAIDSADLVLAQRVVEDYPTPFVRTGELRSASATGCWSGRTSTTGATTPS